MSRASLVVERLDIQNIAHGHRDPAPQNRNSSGVTFLGLGQNLSLEVIYPAAEKLLHGNLAPLVEGGVRRPLLDG